MIVQGKMQYLFDHTGRRYLDLFAGASTSGMGHCHPRVIAKMKEQIDNLNHTTTVYLNDQHSMFAEELADKLPKGLDCIYFTSSGSEANALAT
jgi:alanine-glyoxylate transaminase/(R)-3-amino-2-methylpropionate-pyruvate transaminase